jgi:aminopeptidase-like protein
MNMVASAKIKPIRKNGLHVKNMEDDLVIYDSGKDHLHVLNQTARMIWNLCNGNNSVIDIAENLGKLSYSEHSDQIQADVNETIELLQEKGLIKEL